MRNKLLGFLLIVTAIAFGIIIFYHPKKTITESNSKPDTSRVIAMYHLGDGNMLGGFVYRIIKDSLKLIPTDSSNGVITSKKTLLKDTVYYVPITIADKDSIGKPKLDSLKRPITHIEFKILPNYYILQDYNKK